MKSLLPLVLLCFLLHFASAAIHSWKAYYTGTTGMNEFPEFVAVNVLDDEMMGYFDSKTSRFENRQRWMDEKLGEQYVERQTNALMGHTETFKNNVKIAMQRFNQSQGVHALQLMYGCVLDDDGVNKGYYQLGYDGEDFIALDKDTLTWTAANSQAVITKHKWDPIDARNQQWKDYLENQCIEWLKKYVNYGRETLERKVSPEVSLWQKSLSSPVVCHATGFHPRQVMIAWQKDGEDLNEDVELGETLPNEDGTFQKSSSLKVSPELLDQHKYSCVIQHPSLDSEKLLLVSERRTPPGNEPTASIGIIIGVVAVVLLAVVGCAAFFLMKKWRKPSGSGFQAVPGNPQNSSDNGSASSGP